MNIPKELRDEVAAFLIFLDDPRSAEPSRYELLEARLDCLRFLVESLDLPPSDLPIVQEWLRLQTEPWFSRSPMMNRARTWPEGYPGDYRTLEAVYGNHSSGDGVGLHLDRYFLSRTLAVAVRSRCGRLSELLKARVACEPQGALWLNLACGSCRELLALPPPTARAYYLLRRY